MKELLIQFPLIAGVLASSIHVISGPDHLAAVTPLVVETEKKGWKIGLSWGFGHVFGMLSIGLLFLLFKDLIPVEKISSHSESFVGVILIIVGFWSFYRVFYNKKHHVYPHSHNKGGFYTHIHSHEYIGNNISHEHSTKKEQGLLASFGIGFLHGLAGVAHFILLLPVLSFNSQIDSVMYLVGFAIGTVLSMSAFAFVLDKISLFSKSLDKKIFFTGVRLSSGIFAILIGIYWLLS